MAFKIQDGQEVKDFVFTVYDAETGDPIEPHDGMSIYHGELLLKVPFSSLQETIFALDEDGTLCVVPKEQAHQAYRVSKEGKYIIQFTDGRYMRY